MVTSETNSNYTPMLQHVTLVVNIVLYMSKCTVANSMNSFKSFKQPYQLKCPKFSITKALILLYQYTYIIFMILTLY
jgi:hypothetical protein